MQPESKEGDKSISEGFKVDMDEVADLILCDVKTVTSKDLRQFHPIVDNLVLNVFRHRNPYQFYPNRLTVHSRFLQEEK
ncbi:Hypothetical predicted protein [Octopus vulgaris]|uniref:Uncharacterized protein n=1 Tax=Octopus vulgaris TaxID=6645 RepID=A0AA36FN81_OCTVU|nr:Hypothetical predicted protein [Octopus vulgaris]